MVHARARFTPQMSFSKKLFIICFSNLNLTTHSEIDVSFKNLKQEIIDCISRNFQIKKN